MKDYQATPEQWAQCEEWVQNPVIGASDACILELRARVEALESELKDEVDCNNTCTFNIAERPSRLEANSKPTPNDRQIRSSLVERVHSCIVGEPECGHMQARAAIREVAAWLGDQSTPGTPKWIAAADLIEELERCA